MRIAARFSLLLATLLAAFRSLLAAGALSAPRTGKVNPYYLM